MGTCKNYIIISGLNVNDNNRGTAALGYGSVSFLLEKGFLQENQTLLNFRIYKNPLKKQNREDVTEYIEIDGRKWKHIVLCVSIIEVLLLKKFGFVLPFTRFGNAIRNTERIAAINGGDGFSDIYNTRTFLIRLPETEIAMCYGIPLIVLPQTLGPFEHESNRKIGEKILRYAEKVYVRDDKYIKELDEYGIKYEKTKDLSFYMKPQPWNVDIKENAVGINVSGLAYSNHFRTLAGKFDQYPNLIDKLITYYRDKGYPVYLIPHSYNYTCPEIDNDDMVACRQAYNKLEDKRNVVLLDQDLTSPQVKYVISKMSFFIGTRMHANFAAIYTGVPVFGLAYSYKFQGAFDANGLDGKKQTTVINNMTNQKISSVIRKIDDFWIIQNSNR